MLIANKTLQLKTYKCSLEITFKTSFSDRTWTQGQRSHAVESLHQQSACGFYSRLWQDMDAHVWMCIFNFELLILPSIQTLLMLLSL